MLMMMRADENANIVEGCTAEELLACIAGDNYDECVASCGQEPEGPVKSGTLNVSVEANDGAKAIIGGASELDTINFKTSEAGISISTVVLERYGYSAADGVMVWLEDENGTVVSNTKTINSKDEISLTIKTNYREMDKNDSFVIVTSIDSGATAGTIGFKVKEISSSAETVKIANYTPATYDMVAYTGTAANIAYKGSDSTYHYVNGQSYDVARIKVTAGNAAINVNSFTLTNTGNLDLNRYVNEDDVTVTVDGNNIPATVTINKNNEVEFVLKTAQKIEAKKNVIFVVSLAFDELDVYGKTISFNLTNFRAIEEKTNTRIYRGTITGTQPVYTFNGGQIKLTSTKLGNVDAAAGTEGTIFAEGSIDLNGQIINMANFTLTASSTGIDTIEMLLDGAVIGDATASGTDFIFKGVTIDKNGKLQFAVTMNEEATEKTITITNGSFNKTQFGTTSRYDESNQFVDQNDIVGSISFSTIKVQSAKGSLENSLAKGVEFLTSKTSRQTVFDGIYTAKKGDVKLNEFALTGSAALKTNDTVTFYLSINGSEVASIDLVSGNVTDSTSFGNVLVKKGQEATIKLEAEVYAANTGDYTYTLYLNGEDIDGNEAGNANDDTVRMSFVAQGGVIVAATDAADTVLLRGGSVSLAKFNVKPSKVEGTTLDEITFNTTATTGNIKVKVDGSFVDDITWSGSKATVTLADTLDSDGVNVEIISSKEPSTAVLYTTTVNTVNATTVNKVFKKDIVDALVTLSMPEKQSSKDYTTFNVNVDKYDDSVNVTGLVVMAGTNTGIVINGDVSNTTDEIGNLEEIQYITSISYYINGTKKTISKDTYKDFFKLEDGSYLKAFSNK